MIKPLGDLTWRDNKSALWWLGLLYRRPHRFREALEQLSRSRALWAGLLVLAHALPYVLFIAALFQWFLLGVLDLSLHERVAIDASVLLVHAEDLLWGIAIGIALGIGSGIMGGIGSGIMGGIAGGITMGIALGIALGIAGGITAGIGSGMGGIAGGIALGIAGGIALGIGFIRAYYQPLHLWFVWPALQARWYRLHPVTWDDLSSLSIPGLHRLLVAYAETSPPAGRAEIERLLTSYPSQRMEALRARTILVARQARSQQDLTRIDGIVASLPEGDRGFLTQTASVRTMVGEIAALQRRLDAIDRPFMREPYASLMVKEIESFRGRVSGFREPLASEFRAAAENWLAVAQHQLSEIRSIVGKEPTPQVFRAGDPVDRAQEAFVPRMGVLGQLERQVMLASGCPGLLIYGRRRMGKSTLLRNLNGFLPGSVRIISISMLHPAAFTSVASLARLTMDEIAKSNGSDDRPRSDDLTGLFQVLEATNTDLERKDRRLILAFDEFEQFDIKMCDGTFNQDLLSTIRQSIQMHRRLIWIFAGSHHISELKYPHWASYLVSVQTIEVPMFNGAETRLLLTEPLKESPHFRDDEAGRPRFGAGFWGEHGIEWIHQETGGWPHLVQLVAGIAVDLVNEANVTALDRDMLERAADRSIVDGDTVMRQLMWGESELPGEWDYLAGFRTKDEQPPPQDEEIFQSLRRRKLVAEERGVWRLRVPLMRRWLREGG